MSTPTFDDTYNLVAFLEKLAESARFKQIIDFLKSKPIHYALIVNPTIYVSCVKQFWATTKVKRVNDQEQIRALVDKQKVIITEDIIRSDLYFNDAEGTACLLNEAIFKGLARTGTMASVITCLADNQKFNFSKRKQRKEAEVSHDESEDKDHVPTPFSDPLPSGADSYTLNELMVFCTSLQEQPRSEGLKRLLKIGSGRKMKSSLEKDCLGVQEDASKQGRMIEEIDQDDKIALDADTQGRKNDDEMFGVNDLSGEEVVLDTTTGKHEEQIIEDVSTAEPITTTGEVVTTVAKKVGAALTTDVVVQEQEISTTIPAAATTVTTVVPTPRAKSIVFHQQKQSHIPTVSSSKDKGKAKMIEPKVLIKKKDQMRMDNEYDRQLEAEEQEAARPSRAQQDEEANISWDNTQAMMEADSLLAERLQAKEMEEFRSPTIIDYKIHKEGKKNYFKIIRADGNSQVYQTFEKMFKNFNKEDVEVLWVIVKTRFKKEKPVDDMDNLLFRTLKTMFEQYVEDTIWTYQQGLAKVKN
uniref:Xylulose kinase-1 n=1 Tax=Tanacetum cinerariifolium TaxID=118510 RepID=A0A6L2MD54_TANCI|nr:hypothetical protein [Tanacetum cinerariifolium]